MRIVMTNITAGGGNTVNQDISGFSLIWGGFGTSISPLRISGSNLGCLLNFLFSLNHPLTQQFSWLIHLQERLYATHDDGNNKVPDLLRVNNQHFLRIF